VSCAPALTTGSATARLAVLVLAELSLGATGVVESDLVVNGEVGAPAERGSARDLATLNANQWRWPEMLRLSPRRTQNPAASPAGHELLRRLGVPAPLYGIASLPVGIGAVSLGALAGCAL
jgi:hypothetical protein